MRKKKKEQLISLLQSYKEAHKELKSMILEKKEGIDSLMALCQEGMDKIEADCIKELREEKEQGLLSHCIAAYQKAIFLSHEGKTEMESLQELKKADSILEELIRFIASIPLHVLILFLPYKASMWDRIAFASLSLCR